MWPSRHPLIILKWWTVTLKRCRLTHVKYLNGLYCCTWWHFLKKWPMTIQCCSLLFSCTVRIRTVICFFLYCIVFVLYCTLICSFFTVLYCSKNCSCHSVLYCPVICSCLYCTVVRSDPDSPIKIRSFKMLYWIVKQVSNLTNKIINTCLI